MVWDARRLEDPFEVLAGIFNSAMDAIIAVDSEQCIVLFNPAAERIFGYLALEVLGQPLDILIPQGVRAMHHAHVEKFGRTGVTRRSMGSPGVIAGLRSDGSEFPIEATISQTLSGGKKYYSVILRDVSDRLPGTIVTARPRSPRS